jgi:hypothetical protein
MIPADLYVGALIGVVAVVVAWHCAAVALRSHLSAEQGIGSIRVLETCPSYRWGSIFFVGLLVYSNYALWYSFELREESWEWLRPAWLLVTAAFASTILWRSFCTRIVLEEDGMTILTPLRSVSVSWRDLRRVEWDPRACALILLGTDARFKVSVFMVGVGTLLDRIEVGAPRVDLREVREALGVLSG